MSVTIIIRLRNSEVQRKLLRYLTASPRVAALLDWLLLRTLKILYEQFNGTFWIQWDLWFSKRLPKSLIYWWAVQGSNLRPPDQKSDAQKCSSDYYYSVIVIQFSNWITQNLLELPWINQSYYFESDSNGITLVTCAVSCCSSAQRSNSCRPTGRFVVVTQRRQRALRWEIRPLTDAPAMPSTTWSAWKGKCRRH